VFSLHWQCVIPSHSRKCDRTHYELSLPVARRA
jgi:hypothetical protein